MTICARAGVLVLLLAVGCACPGGGCPDAGADLAPADLAPAPDLTPERCGPQGYCPGAGRCCVGGYCETATCAAPIRPAEFAVRKGSR